ncbi:unnamed protein product [Rodentolepis nana]|uniref:Uncharacterized protein n=1 Tax=Rodentolepis nana TaxID=102285 RepID=A0A3P7V6V8_RODNA|nr:unnamed protein product [Rodentolepis nana]
MRIQTKHPVVPAAAAAVGEFENSGSSKEIEDAVGRVWKAERGKRCQHWQRRQDDRQHRVVCHENYVRVSWRLRW